MIIFTLISNFKFSLKVQHFVQCDQHDLQILFVCIYMYVEYLYYYTRKYADDSLLPIKVLFYRQYSVHET